MTEGIADAFLVLFVLVGGAIVMGHETVQTRTAIKDVLPRIVFAAIAVNASLSLAGLVISTADSLSQAVLGQGVDPSQAAVVLRQLVLGSLADGGIFVVLLGGVVAVLAIVLLATYIVRLALVILLVVAAPICLVCHALPQTEGLAKLWWRAFAGTLAVQVAQSLVLITALRVFLASGGPANLGIASTGGLVDLLVSACLCWVLVKIPGWVSRVVFSGSRGHGGMGRVVRDVIVYKGAKALAAGSRAVSPAATTDDDRGTGADPRRRRAARQAPGRAHRPPARHPGRHRRRPVGRLRRHPPPRPPGRVRRGRRPGRRGGGDAGPRPVRGDRRRPVGASRRGATTAAPAGSCPPPTASPRPRRS